MHCRLDPNPHFLYNTLNSIDILRKFTKRRRIEITAALIQLFKGKV